MSLTRPLLFLLIASFISTSSFAQVANKWAKTFTSGGGHAAVDIKTDAAGNVYVVAEKTGSLDHSVTIKYDSMGNQLWSHIYQWPGHSTRPRKVLVDAAGNVYVGGHIADNFNYNKFLVYKLDPSGSTMLWTDTMNYAGFSHVNSLNEMAFDPQGNIVVAGTMWGINQLWFVAKLSPTGTEMWRSANLLSNLGFLRGMAIDAAGNIYAAGGMVPSSPPGDRWVVRKFNPSGALVWSDVWDADTTVDGYETAFDIGLDAAGNAYALGTRVNGSHYDLFVRKYNPSGATQWSQTISSVPNANIDEGRAIYVSSGGNAYVTGYSRVSPGANRDMMTAKVSTAGVLEWTKVYDNGNDDATLGIHGTSFPEAAVITGLSWSNTGQDIMTIKYKADGTTAWEKRYRTVYYAQGTAVHVGANNDVYVGGYENGMSIAIRIQDADAYKKITIPAGGGTFDFTSSTNGSENTGIRIQLNGGGGDIRVSLLSDSSANITWCADSIPASDISNYRWYIESTLPTTPTQIQLSIDLNALNAALAPFGITHGMINPANFSIYKRTNDGWGQFCKVYTVYINGELRATLNGFSEFIIGSNTDTFNYTIPNSVPTIYSNAADVTVYPNPATEQSTVRFNLTSSAFVTVTLTDVSGRVVSRPFAGEMRGGDQSLPVDTRALSPGLYFCNVQMGGKTAVAKLVVER